MRKTIKALLLDRDGTVIKDKHYLSDPAGVELLPGAGETLGLLAAQGLRFFLVSNQSGVGRGYFSRQDVLACNDRLALLLAAHGARLDGSVFCPHGPDEGCRCRKPAPGMWEELRAAHGLMPEHCLMVGDKPEDMEFARNAGLAAAALVLTGKGTDSVKKLGLETRAVPAGDGVLWVNPNPALSALPDVVMGDFFSLPRALEALERRFAAGAAGPDKEVP